VVSGALLVACGDGSGAAHEQTAWIGTPPDVVELPEGAIETPPPPFTPGIFPCSDCHDPEIPVNTKQRPLTSAHQDIVLHHDEAHRWCLDCHDGGNRDMLHLAGGALVDFSESYKLCGQCHGDKYRDWRAGVHGRRIGQWNGHKSYLLCVQCHNAHSPAFAPLKPKPPPRAPLAAAVDRSAGTPP
jgi:hypothetical protein